MALMISYLFGVTSFRADSVTDGWEIVEGIFWSSLPTGVLFFKIPFTFGVHSILCNLHGGFVFAIVLATNCPSVSLQLYGRLLALIIFIEKKRYCSLYYIGTIDSAHKGESAFIWKSV